MVEAAGSLESLARCGEIVAPGGTIVVLGVHFGPVQLDWMPLFNREARLIPSLGYCAHDGVREMEEAAAMLAEEPEIARTVITHRFGVEDAVEAFRVAAGPGERCHPRRDRAVVRAADQFHVGIVVDDLDTALVDLSELFGYEWCPQLHIQTPVVLPTGEMTLDLRFTYSVSVPRLELIQSMPGTLWVPAPTSGVHHVGYWSDDVASDGDLLATRGYAVEATGVRPDGTADLGLPPEPGRTPHRVGEPGPAGRSPAVLGLRAGLSR